MRQPLTSYLVTTTVERHTPRVHSAEEWADLTGDISPDADLFECMDTLFGESLEHWAWHDAATPSAAIALFMAAPGESSGAYAGGMA